MSGTKPKSKIRSNPVASEIAPTNTNPLINAAGGLLLNAVNIWDVPNIKSAIALRMAKPVTTAPILNM